MRSLYEQWIAAMPNDGEAVEVPPDWLNAMNGPQRVPRNGSRRQHEDQQIPESARPSRAPARLHHSGRTQKP